jgi:hypothetical protein
MASLQPQELKKVREILIGSSLLDTSASRKDFLTNCNLIDYCSSVQCDLEPQKFFQSLYAKLNVTPVNNDENRSGFIVFLEFFIELEPNLNDEKRNFLNQCIAKLESSTSIFSQKSQIQQQLSQNRQGSSSTSQNQTRKTRIKIDHNEIIKFDLTKLKSTLIGKISQYQGAFAFSVGSEELLFREYILKRIECELKDHTNHSIEKIELTLGKVINNYTDIENILYEKYQCQCLTNLFNHEKMTDIMLIVWNHQIPPKNMQELAQAFWNSVSQKVKPFVEKKKCCFLLIWVNVDRKNMRRKFVQEFTVLPTPKKFEFSELEPWFGNLLRTQQVSEENIERYLRRLKRHDGHLVVTFQEMSSIIKDLQGGVRLYG